MRKKGSMITVQEDGRTITRNSSFLKELSKTVPNSDSGDIHDDDFNAPSDNPPPISPDVCDSESECCKPYCSLQIHERSELHPEGMMPASCSFVLRNNRSLFQFLLHCEGPQGTEFQEKSLSFSLIVLEH